MRMSKGSRHFERNARQCVIKMMIEGKASESFSILNDDDIVTGISSFIHWLCCLRA